ncbi:MAG: hypothetical protein KDD61_15250 [Bdellovibrionales bacterium]|nr:hypothetical protein [Bdellovibrionales bacterium]
MSRELNGTLFGNVPSLTSANEMGVHPVSAPKPSDSSKSIESAQKELVVKELIEEIRALKRKVYDLENRTTASESRLHSLATASKSHMERVQGAIHRLDGALKNSVQELTSKFSLLSGKFTEQRVSDTKIQALIDRHNSVIQSFEQRVTQLQKVISEQELKILNYHSTLEEMRRELQRGRR